MNMPFWKRKKKRLPKQVLFEGPVKRMDVRHGSFVWVKDHATGEEFHDDLGIERVVIDLPEGLLSKKVQTKTPEGHGKLSLRYILENLGDRKTYFRYIQFNRPLHVRIYGIPGGDVEITFSEARGEGHGLREDVEEEGKGRGEEDGETDRV